MGKTCQNPCPQKRNVSRFDHKIIEWFKQIQIVSYHIYIISLFLFKVNICNCSKLFATSVCLSLDHFFVPLLIFCARLETLLFVIATCCRSPITCFLTNHAISILASIALRITCYISLLAVLDILWCTNAVLPNCDYNNFTDFSCELHRSFYAFLDVLRYHLRISLGTLLCIYYNIVVIIYPHE